MLIKETWVERESEEQHCIIGESDLYEPFTDNIKRLFLSLQREYGKCTSKVYQDTPSGIIAIGWVFEKMVKYSDCNKYYLQETWIELHDSKPDTKTTYHYHTLKG